MTATLSEELDIAEVLAYRHEDTPLWNELMEEYNADVVDELGQGRPDMSTLATDDDRTRPASGDDPGGDPVPDQGEPSDVPRAEPEPAPAPQPAEPETAEPTPETGD